jgi:protein involved in polysaccharide export with SLBB domain
MMRIACALVALITASFILLPQVNAQSVPDDILLQFQQRLQRESEMQTLQPSLPLPGRGQGQREGDVYPAPQPQMQPSHPDMYDAPSAVERDYSARLDGDPQVAQPRLGPDGRPVWPDAMAAEAPLKQVGYAALRGQRGALPGLVGAVDGAYRLDVGDEIVITLRGSKNATYRTVIDRDGRLVVPDLAPVPAAGRAFAELRADIVAQVNNEFLETDAFVSVGAIRQMAIMVSGEVERPGVVQIPGMASLVDALIQAGGIRKTGTLRRVTVVRDGESRIVDLYPVLLGTSGAPDITIKAGDRIVVPTLGATVAVSGKVVRAGIYELRGQSASAADVLHLAGGALSPTGNRYVKKSQGASGRNVYSELAGTLAGALRRGDILMVEPGSEGAAGAALVTGHVTSPGLRSLASIPSVGALLSNRSILSAEPYLPFVVVKTRDPVTLAPRFEAVDGGRIMETGQDLALQDQDTVIILSMSDVRYLFSTDVQRVLSGQMPLYGRNETYEDLQQRAQQRDVTGPDGWPVPQGLSAQNAQGLPGYPAPGAVTPDPAAVALQACDGLRVLASQVARRAISLPQQLLEEGEGLADVQACPEIFQSYPELLPYTVEHLMTLQGAVRIPGAYPVVEGGRLADVVGAAGGTSSIADLTAVEVTLASKTGAVVRQMIPLSVALNDYTIEPRASVRINARFSDQDTGPVVLAGEVRRPGRYSITRGERLSDVIERAGGLTEQAYTLGAVFTRESIRVEEQASYERLEREVRSGMPAALQEAAARDASSQQAVLAAIRETIALLQSAKASGRMVVDVDPTLMQVRPDQDIVLQPGDRLVVPKRPAHIMVSGEVMHPGSQRFAPGRPADEYIQLSGGVRDSADTSRIFAILPNGEARPLRVSFWNYSEVQLPPGSTIVVPRDLTPLSFWGVTKDLLDIFGNIAISAAALASISD